MARQSVALSYCLLWLSLLSLLSESGRLARADGDSGVPSDLLQPFGSYPNVWALTDEDRQFFHPVLKVDPPYLPAKVLDCRFADGLATADDLAQAKGWRRRLGRFLQRRIPARVQTWVIGVLRKQTKAKDASHSVPPSPSSSKWMIGRYDENRVGMYTSDHFQDTSNQIDGYGGQRTVHLGVDLGGPVGTPVHAFADGVVHSVGYNAEFGDYGYVVVIEHALPNTTGRLWALYGHLDKSTLCHSKRSGKTIRKGQIIGRLGDCHENGGWKAPHVHFQLSTSAPETHDMPGASSVEDRPKALQDYPDPRYVLGSLY